MEMKDINIATTQLNVQFLQAATFFKSGPFPLRHRLQLMRPVFIQSKINAVNPAGGLWANTAVEEPPCLCFCGRERLRHK